MFYVTTEGNPELLVLDRQEREPQGHVVLHQGGALAASAASDPDRGAGVAEREPDCEERQLAGLGGGGWAGRVRTDEFDSGQQQGHLRC